jgi:hypothetical protein
MSNSLNIHDAITRKMLMHTSMHGENKRCINCLLLLQWMRQPSEVPHSRMLISRLRR